MQIPGKNRKRPAPFVSSHAEKRVKDATLLRYREAYKNFFVWLFGVGLTIIDLGDLDWSLVEYGEYVETFGVFSLTISAVLFFYSKAKGSIPFASQVLRGWELEKDIRHCIPMSWAFVLGLALSLALSGFFLIAAGLVLQYYALLRPSELLNLERDDIVLPEQHQLGGPPKCFILLGTHTRGTKVRREQTAAVSSVWGIAAARFMVVHGAKQGPLLGIDYPKYAKLLARACVAQGVQTLGFKAHSPRPGRATDLYLEKVSFKQIQDEGRWLAETSCRIYLDRARALCGKTLQYSRPFRFLVNDPKKVGNIFIFTPVHK